MSRRDHTTNRIWLFVSEDCNNAPVVEQFVTREMQRRKIGGGGRDSWINEQSLEIASIDFGMVDEPWVSQWR